MVNYESVGGRIKRLRLRKGLTQERLAEICSISPTYIGVLEGGHKKPSIETLVKISKGLEVSTDYLLADSIKDSSDSKIQELASIVKNLDNDEMNMVIDVISTLVSHLHKRK